MTRRPAFIRGDRYSVGDDGRVYSNGKPMIGHVDRDGYQHVSLRLIGRDTPKRFAVHRLVCIAFHGAPTSGDSQVRHLDGTRTNNVPGNLKWGSAKDNHSDRIKHGRTFSGSANPNAVLTEREAASVARMHAAGLSQWFIADIMSISQSQVSRIVRRQRGGR